MARDNPVPGFGSITQNGLSQARSNHSLINGQDVRRNLQICGEAQGQPHCPPLFFRDPYTGSYVEAGEEIREAVLRTYPAADVKSEPFISPDSSTSGPVQGENPSHVSYVNDGHPRTDGSECRHADTINDDQDQKHEEHGDEEDPSQDLSDVDGECRVEDRLHPVRADEIELFLRVLFRYGIQQKGCKKILQYWLKKCHPKKQATHPYNGGQKQEWNDEENKGEFTAPPYWPPQANWDDDGNRTASRHKEPDHLRKYERLNLCCHLLTRGKVEEYDFSVDILEESTKELTGRYPEHFPPEADQYLASIYQLRREQIKFEDGAMDGDSKILIRLPPKAKIHDIQSTAKPRQQLPKKARPTVPAIEPKVRSLLTKSSELETAFHGHPSDARHIKMETETTTSRSSSFHAATSTTEQSADDDEAMTTEPCSSLTSPMAIDSPIEAGNGSSFGHDSHTSSCRSGSLDMSMNHQPVVKAEEQQFSRNPWSYGNAGMQPDMPLTSNSTYVIPQQAVQNYAFDHGSYNTPGSQGAGVSSDIFRLGSPGYGGTHMLASWPLQSDGFPDGVAQSSYAIPNRSYTSSYDSNQFSQSGNEHLVERGWFPTYLDCPGYNDMRNTQIFCPDRLHHGNHSTAAERRQLYTPADWPSSAQA